MTALDISKTIAVIGAGTMGAGIAQVAAKAGHIVERLLGMHFFNPAPIMKLVEIISGLATDKGITEDIFDTATAWGKLAVHAKSTPGFIVNRVNYPIGPLAWADKIGLPQVLEVLDNLALNYGEDRFRPSALILRKTASGEKLHA